MMSVAMSVPRVLARRWLSKKDGGGVHTVRRSLCVIDGHFEYGANAFRARELGLIGRLRLSKPSDSHVMRSSLVEPDDVALHIRLGDFRNHAGGSYLLAADYYRKALDMVGQETRRIRVFSDEPHAAVNMLTVDVGIASSRLMVHEPLSAPEELDFFASHAIQVISNSTFSWWGGFLAPPTARVMGPARHPSGLGPYWIPVE